MTFSKFEKYAAGKIRNHASEVNGDALWNDILPQVQKGNNRRRGIIWFFFIGLIASFIALYTLTDAENSDAEGEITRLSSVGFIDENHSNTPSIPNDNETIPVLNEGHNTNEAIDQNVQINNNQINQLALDVREMKGEVEDIKGMTINILEKTNRLSSAQDREEHQRAIELAMRRDS